MSQIAVITGANRGLGLATATALAGQGHLVILAARSADKVRAAAAELAGQGMSAEWLELDVDSDVSVAAAADEVSRRHGHVDILINNAGILPEATDTQHHDFSSSDIFRTTFQTNVFGPVAVIEAFLPLLRASAAGRIVNVSSTVGSLADQTDPGSPYYPMVLPAYQSSKAALNNVTIALSKKLADTDIKVTSVCPGWVQTDLTPSGRAQAPLTAEEAAQTVVEAALLGREAASGTFVDQNGPVAW